jgi:hypothetical protein
MAMKTFIRVCEIWVPSKYRTELEFHSGLYGALQQFRHASERMCFGYDEGLPGKAWAARHPIILKDLQHSYFKRAASARQAGLTCGIAIPVFAGDYLLAVVVLYCGDDEEHFGAIELWHAEDGADLTLVEGYYGAASQFEAVSRDIAFKPGAGLPGKVWESGMPEVMSDLWYDQRFQRRGEGQPLGLSKGLAIPLLHQGESYVMTFLSALGSPVARRFEIWAPDAGGEAMLFGAGECDLNKAFPQDYANTRVARGEGPIGRVWASGLPEAFESVAQDQSAIGRSARKAGLESMLAMPVLEDGRLKAVVALYF